jgi:outer membrane protein OmpA-like peptidoglycan-associated protein
MRYAIATLGLLVGSAAWSSAASAQESGGSYLEQRVPPPSDAFELKVGTGYTQGLGNIAPGRTIRDVAGAGIGVSVDADYRLNPLWSLGVEGQYQEFTAERNSGARGFAGNVGATYHFAPVFRGDPWLRLGTGYRLLWENDPVGATAGISVLRHGFDWLTAKVGYDVRVSEDVALAPVIGADFNTFFWEEPSNGDNHVLSSAQIGTFLYAGLQGRFDIGGKRGSEGVASQQPIAVTAPQAQSPIAPPPIEPTKPVSDSIAVSEEILRRCEMDLGSVDKAPKFDFDRSDLLPSDIAVLDQVAECFSTGPMKGERMRLVGRADPRGSLEYNDSLGMRRANHVAAYLEGRGIDSGRVEEISRGKLDARGTDEPTWAVDRRVDIVQAR